jgi:hypothetical protein
MLDAHLRAEPVMKTYQMCIPTDADPLGQRETTMVTLDYFEYRMAEDEDRVSELNNIIEDLRRELYEKDTNASMLFDHYSSLTCVLPSRRSKDG